MTTVHRSFRLFGNFRMGRERDEDNARPIRGNLVEIFHSAYSGQTPLRSFARVSRLVDGADLPNRPEIARLPPFERNIFIDAAREQIENDLAREDEVTFWVSEPPRPLEGRRGRRLYLFDALCLDQFEDSASETASGRFPLVPRFRENNEQRSSRITFGSGGTYSLRLELGFAMPLPIGSRADRADGAPGVLCIGGTYPTTRAIDLSLIRSNQTLIGPGNSTIIKSHWTVFGTYALAPTISGRNNVVPVGEARGAPDFAPLLAKIGFDGQPAHAGSDHVIEFKSERLTRDENAPYYAVACRRRVPLVRGPHIDLDSGNKARLDLDDHLGGMVEVDQRSVLVECHWGVKLTDALVLKSLFSRGNPTGAVNETLLAKADIHASLRWTSSAELSNRVLGLAERSPPLDEEGRLILRAGGLEEAARLSLNTARALVATDRQPQSILPSLTVPTRGSRWQVPLIGHAKGLTSAFALTSKVAINREDAASAPVAHFGITVDRDALVAGDRDLKFFGLRKSDGWPSNKPWTLPLEADPPLSPRMVLPWFDDSVPNPDPETHHNHIRIGYHDRAQEAEETESGVFFAIGNDDAASMTPHGPGDHFSGLEARLGSLGFSRSGRLLVDAPPAQSLRSSDRSQLVITRRDRRRVNRRLAARAMPTLNVAWKMVFAIDSAQPVTTDIPHGDRDERPSDLLIRETPLAAADPTGTVAPFRLIVTEELRDDQDRLLKAELFENTGDDGHDPATFTVLSQKPFSVYRFSRRPLSSANEAESPVATFNGDAREWRLQKGSDTYLFLRPAGATGEDADKPGMLELHDPHQRSAVIPPAPAPDGNVERRHVLDTRLSPPTALWVDPSDLPRDFLLPEYAGRALFRQRGDFGLGMKISALRTELLYGLSTGLLIPENADGRPGPRIAELKALTGAMVGDDDGDPKSTLFQRWKRLREAFEQRPERLEVWTLDARRENPFVPARFDTGLSFALRSTALLAPPVKSGEIDATEAEPPELAPARFHPHGLSGGALWPLESANIARILAGNPVGSSGTLEAVALSPLGDSGDQTARFLNDVVTIITETRDGFLHKQRVEVLGRIAGLWHRAKHVVVYERTTAASPQFTPEPDQPTRTHRPVLRKVEEFVEILQPSRRYPDMPDVVPRTRGCLEEVRFNSRIIHVNSAWGRDVGDTGWEVPLWNRGEAEVRPQIYPYPDVAFLTVAEGNSATAQASQECLDVANLYFYTDPAAARTTSDTDAWPVRYGVDTSGFGMPEAVQRLIDVADQPVDSLDDSDPPAKVIRRPAAARILPGLKRFTWRLAPSPTRSRINAERGEKPIFAGLEAVTLLRAAGGTADGWGDVVGHIEERGEFGKLEEQLRPDLVLPRTRETATEGLTVYDDVATALAGLTPDTTPSVEQLDDLLGKLEDLAQPGTATRLNTWLTGDAADLVSSVQGLMTRAKSTIDRAKAFDEADCNALATKAAGTIRRRKLLCLQMVRQAQSETLAQIREASEVTRQEAETWLKGHVRNATRDLFEQATQGLGDVRGGVATARAVVGDWRADAVAALARARARVAALRNAYDFSKPWSRNRLDQALVRLQNQFDAADKEALAALDEARLRLATELDSAANGVGARVTQTIARILRTERKLLARYDSFQHGILVRAKAASDAIDKLPTEDDLNAKFDDLAAKANAIGDAQIRQRAVRTLEVLRTAIDRTNIDDRKTDAQGHIDLTRQFIQDSIEKISETTQSAASEASNSLREVEGLIAATKAAADEFVDAQTLELRAITRSLHGELVRTSTDIQTALEDQKGVWVKELDVIKDAFERALALIDANTGLVERAAGQALGAADQWLAMFETRLRTAENLLKTKLSEQFTIQVINPAVNAVFDTTNWPDTDAAVKAHAINVVQTLTDRFEAELDAFSEVPLSQISEAQDACIALVGYKAKFFEGIDALAVRAETELKAVLCTFKDKIEEVKGNLGRWSDHADDIIRGTEELLDTTNEIANQLAEAGENARAYVDRGAEILAGAADTKPAELPGLALQLITAATQAPEIAAFRTNADRIRVLMNEAEKVLKTPAIRGSLDQLGDALKALGLDFNFQQFGDQFDLKAIGDDGKTLLRRLIPDIGGIKLSDMLPRAAVPGGLANAVKLTHDLDTKAGRAWVQADVNVPLPGRETLFSIGPFTLFLRDSRLNAFVRAEASKDQKEAALSDQALLITNIDAVVAGQVMVTLEDVAISYSSREQLEFALDPKKIRIHQSLRFIQDTLGSLFGDELGGLKFLKEGGIPVGVEHQFSIPPISLMYGTSGVSNLQISNRFSLRAFPDFIIANRFNLSRRELPFLFSIFIIGGTGYIQVDTEYRPFDKRLMVAVEAAAGGSAALGFAFGPIAGGVFISLSVALRYQKRLGSGPKANDGLSVSVVLVIAGNVSLWGIATIYIGLMLSMTYHESGRIDGLGQLSVELRISRWFKLRYSTQVRYRLRNGRTETQVTSETSTSGKYTQALKKFEALDKARKSL